MVSARPLLLAALLGCRVDLGLEEERFACTSDADCASGFVCDSAVAICTRIGTRTDAGTTCGFDDTLDQENDAFTTNGDAVWVDGFVQLTPPVMNRSGTLWFNRPIRAERFTFEITYFIPGLMGSRGGEGLAMAWIRNGPDALGGAGASLGVYGLDGYALEVDTNPSVGEPASQHLALVEMRNVAVDVIETATITGLRSPTDRTVRLEVDGPAVEVFLDDTPIFTANFPAYAPFDAFFGVGAATGPIADRHAITRIRVVCR